VLICKKINTPNTFKSPAISLTLLSLQCFSLLFTLILLDNRFASFSSFQRYIFNLDLRINNLLINTSDDAFSCINKTILYIILKSTRIALLLTIILLFLLQSVNKRALYIRHYKLLGLSMRKASEIFNINFLCF